jgi:hypothetical protein
VRRTAELPEHRFVAIGDDRTIGTRERIAQHRHQWRDVILIERRSPNV